MLLLLFFNHGDSMCGVYIKADVTFAFHLMVLIVDLISCSGELQQSQFAQKQDPLLKCGVYAQCVF